MKANDGAVGMTQARQKLASPFHADTLKLSVKSIVERIHPSGYVPESTTGAYGGMFPRTLSALAQLFISIGRPELMEKPLAYCLRTATGHGLSYFPHTIAGPANDRDAIPPIYDNLHQADGVANTILAWAMTVIAKNGSAFEDLTYADMARMLNNLLAPPYLAMKYKWRMNPGLALNTCLEHSRDWEPWIAFDFLTQSFVAAALSHMATVAERRQDNANAENWRKTLSQLEANVEKHLTYDRNGKKLYHEMLLPTGKEPAPFDGISWLNLAAIPANWTGVNPQVFRNTINEWRRLSAIKWDGPSVTGCDWTPAGHTGETYGKMLGWELVFLAREGCWPEVEGILDFLEQVNGDGIYAEIFRYGDDQYGHAFNPNATPMRWHTRDRGNGEQCAWLSWSMIEVRKLAGLQPLPD